MCWLRILLLISLALEFVVAAYIPKPSPDLHVYYERLPGTANAAYYFVYDKDGKFRMERGEVRISKGNKPYLVITGTYTYTDDDGKIHTIKYTKDENDFRQHEVERRTSEQEGKLYTDKHTKDENKKQEVETQTPEEKPVNKIDTTLLGSLLG